MYIVLVSAIIVNILSIIMFLIGLFYNFKQPKNKAIYGYLVVVCVILYIITLSMTLIYDFFVKHYLYSFILFLCIVSPFVIGKFVKYDTLKKYTILQIMFFIVSMFTILLDLLN